MKQTIYLYCDRWGVNKMTKNLTAARKDEIVVKATVEVADSAYREPVIEKHIIVEDWRQGIDIADVDFKETTITEEEATRIRQMRLEKMQEIMRANGYEVTKIEGEE